MIGIVALCGASDRLDAQIRERRPVIAFAGIRQNFGDSTLAEVRVLENRVTAHLVDVARQDNYSLVIPRNRVEILENINFAAIGDEQDTPQRLVDLVSANGLIGGELNQVDGRYHLDLYLIRPDAGAIISFESTDARDFRGLMNQSAGIVYALFGLSPAGASEDATVSEDEDRQARPATLEDLAGVWTGDQGIDTVEISADGSAIANLSSGDTMQLRVALEDGRIVVRQNEPNAPKMYLSSFPYSIAVQIVDLARPMSWVFGYEPSEEALVGIKRTTLFRVDRGRVVQADNTYTREAVWARRD